MSEKEFSEDLYEKAERFYAIRGRQSDARLNKRWHAALAQADVLRHSRTAKPGSRRQAAGEGIQSHRQGKTCSGHSGQEPLPAGAEAFASECVDVQLDKRVPEPAMLRLRMKRGATSRFSLRTVMVFRWEARLRRWHLVDSSGYSKASRGAWAHGSGAAVVCGDRTSSE